MLKLKVILTLFQVEVRQDLLTALASYIQMNLIKVNGCPEQPSALVSEYRTEQSISLQLQHTRTIHTYTGKNIPSSEFIPSYLTHTSAIFPNVIRPNLSRMGDNHNIEYFLNNV